jgi:glycosyltransferase involved in cell wall biosynthesis
MAVYNGEKYITEQLDSIRRQSLPPDYLIIRDDQSTDDTVQLAERYIGDFGLANWVVKRNEINLGWKFNFRQLMIDALATDADYISLCDQDDIWDSDKLKNQITVLNENPEIELLSGDPVVRKEIENAIVSHTVYDFHAQGNELSQYPPRFSSVVFRVGWTYVVRRSLLEDILPFWKAEKPRYDFPHDALLSTVASLLGAGFNLNKSVGTFRRHETNVSGTIGVKISSSKEYHIFDLEKEAGFFQVVADVLRVRKSPFEEKIKAYRDFYQKRLDIAKSGKKLPVMKQIIADRKYYSRFTGPIRDLIFMWKKS